MGHFPIVGRSYLCNKGHWGLGWEAQVCVLLLFFILAAWMWICLYLNCVAIDIIRWGGLKTFLEKPRTPLYCGGRGATKGFVNSYQNLHFYWILGAGHFVRFYLIVLFKLSQVRKSNDMRLVNKHVDMYRTNVIVVFVGSSRSTLCGTQYDRNDHRLTCI